MKNKKGFTLIELLAVITILGIILVIAVPKISDMIYDRKKDTFFASAKSILRKVEYDNVDVSSFTASALSSLNLTGISSTDYDLDTSIVYMTGDVFYIDLVGSGQYSGLYACGVSTSTKDNNVQEQSCA